MGRSSVLGMVAAAMAMATIASAQEPVADTYERLREANRLKPGDAVSVTRGDGTQPWGLLKASLRRRSV